MHECGIMRNRLKSSNLWLTPSIQKWKQDTLSKIDTILNNSNLDSLLKFLRNQLDYIGFWKLDWKSDNELETYYNNVELIIKKIINNKNFIIEIIWSKLSWEEYEKTRELLEFASRINPDILDETDIWKVLSEIDKEKEEEEIEKRIKEVQAKKNEKILIDRYQRYKRKEISLISLTSEDLRVLQEEGVFSEETIKEWGNYEGFKDLTQIIK